MKEAREALEEAQRLLPDDEQSVLQNMAALAEHEEFYRNNKAGSAKGSMAAKAANSEVNGDLALAARLTEEAISLAEANKMQDAFGLFEQAALASPLDSKLWENLGVTEMRMGQLANSQANFQKAKDLFVGVFEGSSLEKNIAALQTHLDFAAKNQATASDEYWSEEDDEDYEDEEDAASLEEKLQALTDEAILKADADDLLGALLLFQKAAHLSPRSFKQHENVGVTQMRLGLLDAARASLEKASELLGGATSASLLDNFKALSEHEAYAKSIGHNPAMVYAEFSKGNDGQGLAGVEDEYDEDADDEYRDDAYAAEVDPLRAEELTEEAITAAEGGNFENALELFQEAADANPTEGRMWENLGVTQMRANYLDDALVSFKRARKLSPKLDNRNLEALQEHLDHRASVQAAREQAMNPNYARIGKFSSEAQSEEEVEDAEKSALGAESESKEVTIVLNQPLGISLWPGLLIERVATGGQLETTAAAGDRVLSVASTHVWSFDQLKMELEAMRNAGLPSAVLTVAHSLKKTNATPSRTSSSGGSPEEEESALVKEAVDYLSTGNLESALSSFQAALELSPQKGELWANVGNVQRDLGLTDEALKSYERGLVLDPDSSLLSTNLNELRASQGAARSGGVSLSEQERSEGAGFCDDGFNTEVTRRETSEEQKYRVVFMCIHAHMRLVSRDVVFIFVPALLIKSFLLLYVILFFVQLVHVGDKVEVRDSGGSWALGVVEGVNPSTNQPSVTKDGFDADYEWDECRLPR